MSRVTHSLVGYDRETERVVEEFDVPDAMLPRAKELARVPTEDPEAIMCYPLDILRARDLANIIKATIDTERREYFLEGIAVPDAAYDFADDAKFRLDALTSSVWVHNDEKKHHIKVTVTRETLDDYASSHSLRDHCAVVNRLNAGMKHQVRQIINRAIDNGRAISGNLELNGHDLGVMLDG